LRISDDGRGFAGERPGGLGVLGMRERALLVGGRLTIGPADPRGTYVEVTLP
jgi:two-component system sensor histidine kinase UhpB